MSGKSTEAISIEMRNLDVYWFSSYYQGLFQKIFAEVVMGEYPILCSFE